MVTRVCRWFSNDDSYDGFHGAQDNILHIIYLGVGFIFSSFVMSSGRLLNCFIIVENLSFLAIMFSLFNYKGMLFLGLVVVVTIERVLALVVLFRLWDTRGLSDVVGR